MSENLAPDNESRLFTDEDADAVARRFHEAYEEAAPRHGWETQQRSRRDWDDVPEENRQVMRATVRVLLETGVIALGRRLA